MNWRVPLATPDLGDEEVKAVTEVLQRKWLTMGEVTRTFEDTFARRLGVKHALSTSSCTAALHMANLALSIGEGDEVICPALTFVATANAIRYTHATPVFADVVSAHDLTVSPQDIEQNITTRTKAIVVVHYAGFPCLMDEILAIARKYDLRVVEDCAHAPFAWIPDADGDRRFTGTIGDIGCFSFFSNKNMTTGEGGMLTTNDDALYERLRMLRSHGMTTSTFDRHRRHSSEYDVVALGYNYRMDEIRAAIGLCQLEKIDRINLQHRRVYSWYTEQLAGSADVIVPFLDRNIETSACHIMPVIIDGDLDAARRRLETAGIQTSRHYKPVTSFSIYNQQTPPKTDCISRRLLTLPLSVQMTSADTSFVVSVLNDQQSNPQP